MNLEKAMASRSNFQCNAIASILDKVILGLYNLTETDILFVCFFFSMQFFAALAMTVNMSVCVHDKTARAKWLRCAAPNCHFSSNSNCLFDAISQRDAKPAIIIQIRRVKKIVCSPYIQLRNTLTLAQITENYHSCDSMWRSLPRARPLISPALCLLISSCVHTRNSCARSTHICSVDFAPDEMTRRGPKQISAQQQIYSQIHAHIKHVLLHQQISS